MKELAQKILENVPALIELLSPEVQNIIMNRKFDAACIALQGVKDRLAKFGLEIDYREYFKHKLQVPLMLLRDFSELEADEQIKLLQNLFLRHLTKKYTDDTRYPSFIRMLEVLTALDIHILNLIYKYKDNKEVKFPTTEREYVSYLPNGETFRSILKADWPDVRESVDNLLSMRLLDELHTVDVLRGDTLDRITEIDAGEIGEGVKESNFISVSGGVVQKAVSTSSPVLTRLGLSFMKACSDPFSD